MTDIVEFLTARLDEDEAGALATTPVPVPGHWKAARDKHADAGNPLHLVQGEDKYEPGSEDYSGNSPVIAYSAEWQTEAEANLRHIARHDPARVLAEVAAKREHLRMYVQQLGMLNHVRTYSDQFTHDTQVTATVSAGVLEAVVRQDAAVYDQHPDYNPAWRAE